MAEQVGIIVKAGEEMKADQSGTVFKMGVDKFTYSLFDGKLQAIAKEHLGKRVKVTYKMSEDGKYRNVESIESSQQESQDSSPVRQWGGKSPEEIASIERQVAAKIVGEKEIEAVQAVVQLLIHGSFTSADPEFWGMRLWLQRELPIDEKALAAQVRVKATAELAIQEAEGKNAGKAPLDKPLDTKANTPRQAPVEGEKVRLELFKVQCKRKGWDWQTKKDSEAIKGKLAEWFAGLTWAELTPEAQERAIEQMRQMADEKEAE